jgi:two-component system phosphate regulon sensor histidine kinase PhoR
MDKNIRKIFIVLVFIILFPALFFAVYEINSLTSNEQIIERIYTNQVESILFSVNQFSEDFVSRWRSTILEIREKKDQGRVADEINILLHQKKSLRFVFFADSSGNKKYYFDEKDSNEVITNAINEMYTGNQVKIDRLYNYSTGGYFKIEPLPVNLKDRAVVVTIIETSGGKELLGLGIDPEYFVKQILAPKIQSVVQNEFIVSVFRKSSGETVYSTGKSEIILQPNGKVGWHNPEYSNEKELWLIPEYSLGIALIGGTIQSLVKERAETNLMLISILIIILLIGGWIVFRNIKKEVLLAKIKSDFVSNVSHELRTPLALISMFAETLEMGRVKSEEKKVEYYTIISHEASRLSKIVNRILNFSQAEAGKRKYSFSFVQINDILQEVYDTYKFHLQNKGFKFTYQPDESLPLIYADKEAVSEAVINLVDNAVKYSSDNKEVELSSGMIGEFVYLKVRDHGIGITDQDQKRIFDKFFRVSSGQVHDTKGTGLGLSLVKQIIEAHKGEITLHSALEKGSSFILKFKTNA